MGVKNKNVDMNSVEVNKLPCKFERKVNDIESDEVLVPYQQLRWGFMCECECGSDVGNTGHE